MGGPGKEHRTNKPSPTGRVLTSIHLGWAMWCATRKDSESKWLAKDNPETNPINIKPETASHVAEQFSWVPLLCCSPLGCPLPIKSLDLSAHVSSDNSFPRIRQEPNLWALEGATLSLLWAQVWSLVRELGFCQLHVAKKPRIITWPRDQTLSIYPKELKFGPLMKEETEQALSRKQDSILGWTVVCPVSMETYQLENQAPRRKSPRALCCLKEYPNYLRNQTESYILLLCLLGYDHRPIDNCPLLTTQA